MKILLAEKTGFCFGVKRAIDIVNKSVSSRGSVETLGAIVHNQKVLDDMAAMGDSHYPCIIYMREGGRPIGKIGTGMRQERQRWYEDHDCTKDTICSGNCLDVCVEYNTKHESFNERNKP